eukprot:7662512-Ditylum_brightwellii.AAC.1
MLSTQVDTLTEEIVSLSGKVNTLQNTLTAINNVLVQYTNFHKEILMKITDLHMDSQQSNDNEAIIQVIRTLKAENSKQFVEIQEH